MKPKPSEIRAAELRGEFLGIRHALARAKEQMKFDSAPHAPEYPDYWEGCIDTDGIFMGWCEREAKRLQARLRKMRGKG